MRRTALVVLVCSLVAALPSCALGVDLKAGESVIYPKKEVVEDDVMAAGSQVLVEPEVKGDVTAAGQNVTVAGPVKDSVVLAGQNVTASGSIGNDAWMAGSSVMLNAPVADNAYLAGGTVALAADASVGTDLLAAGNNIAVMGDVSRHLRAAGSTITIAGRIGGNVYADGDTIRILEGALIEGDFCYESPKPAAIARGARIQGQTVHSLPKEEKIRLIFWPTWARWIARLLSLIAAVVFGSVLLALFPARGQEAANTVRRSFWASLGIGLLVLIVAPVACVLAMITLVGIPVALAVIAVYLILLYAAGIFVALALGQWIIGMRMETPPKPVGSMILGLVTLAVVATLLGMIPRAGWFLAWLTNFVVLTAGLGALSASWWQSRRPGPVPAAAAPPPATEGPTQVGPTE